ncbi:MAG: lamin tail domain-containing protein [Reichenbachiella sp.]
MLNRTSFIIVLPLVLGFCMLILPSKAQVRINEFQASNSATIDDPDYSESSDWIEVHNVGSTSLDLQGYYLSDNLDTPDKWQITNPTVIQAGGFWLFWADGMDTGNHTNFKLSAAGEQIGLYDPSLQLVDSITYSLQQSDVSMGRNSSNEWVFYETPTPASANVTTEFSGFTTNIPTFSVLGGLFDNSLQVTISSLLGGEIRYTLDGAEPDVNSTLNSTPIDIASTTILRARIFRPSAIPGPVVTHSYFLQSPHILPIVSIATDPDNFWHAEDGIYVQDFKPDWEIPINIELFENIGGDRAAINQTAGTKVNGLYSWKLPQKMLGIYFKGRYSGDLKYPLFYDRKRGSFDDFALRASGSDWSYTLFRDILGQEAVSLNTNLATMGFRESVVYVNGQYMGIHNMRSKVNEDFIIGNFGLAKGTFDLIENEEVIEAGDLEAYEHLESLFSEDLTVQANFDAVANLMDIENFTDMVITEIYVRNTSIGHNVMCWKPKNEGKWQWIVMDLDRGFFKPESNLIGYFMDRSVIPFDELMANDDYRNYFANRMMDHLLTTFHQDKMSELIDKHQSTIEAEMPRHIERWLGRTSSYGNAMSSEAYWHTQIDNIRSFTQQRPGYIIADLANYGFASTHQIALDVEPAGAGQLWLNDLKYTPGYAGDHLTNSSLTLKAKPNPGHQFSGWKMGNTDNLISTTAILNHTLISDVQLTAVFEDNGLCSVPVLLTDDLTLSVDCSPYVTIGDIVVPEDVTLTIEAGVELRMTEGADIIINGTLEVLGTEASPVLITRAPSNDIPWGAIVLLNTTTTSHLQYATIEKASVGPIPTRDKAAISLFKSSIDMDHVTIVDVASNPIFAQYATVKLSNSHLHSAVTGDLINVKYGSAQISNTIFEGNQMPDTDGIDYDQVTDGIISNCTFFDFQGSNSDAIDIGENAKNIMIDHVICYNITDKAVSVGQQSSAHISNSLFINTHMGVAVKDSSTVWVAQSTFYNTALSVACYEKNPGRAGGNATLRNCILSNSPLSSYLSDQYSTIDISYSLSDTDELPTNSNNLFGNPQFKNTDAHQFELNESSLALANGDQSQNLGAPIFELNFDSQVKIVQIFSDPGETGASDFVAITNPTNQDIDVSGYTVDRGFTMTIDENTSIAAHDTLFLTNNSSITWWSNHDHVQQWQDGQLSKGGETIQLINPNGIVVDHVKYDNKSPWPEEIGVYTLKSIDTDNHLGENWTIVPDNRIFVPLSIKPDALNDWNIYPNPSSGLIQVQFETVNHDQLDFYTLSGKWLKSIAINNNLMNIDVSNLPRGFVLVKYRGSVQKLILN